MPLRWCHTPGPSQDHYESHHHPTEPAASLTQRQYLVCHTGRKESVGWRVRVGHRCAGVGPSRQQVWGVGQAGATLTCLYGSRHPAHPGPLHLTMHPLTLSTCCPAAPPAPHHLLSPAARPGKASGVTPRVKGAAMRRCWWRRSQGQADCPASRMGARPGGLRGQSLVDGLWLW
ncbi:hypothetical protein Hamer_G023419 [Homarus americanus]|uniref:Uncharacterized protein n=1 Tax=Homarus americanus TaxID=6706 RepID=A0A8J5JQV1_HOMAM|nr:hypothetical protein Hamer_G023419 [Homarus americanus]